jgi:hypothetical protein
MSKTVAYTALIGSFVTVIVLAVGAPSLLSDNGNGFMKGFVGHELLAILGVILAITLASAAQLHLTFNKIEEDYKQKNALNSSRRAVQSASYWLIGLFMFAVGLVVIKPLLAKEPWSQTIFNGLAIIILLAYVFALIDLLKTTFAISPKIDD